MSQAVTSTVGCKVTFLLPYLQTPGARADVAQGWSAVDLCYIHQSANHPLPIVAWREMAEQQLRQQTNLLLDVCGPRVTV